MGSCAVFGMTNQYALSEDLESDPFLNLALQKFTCEFYYRFGSFLASLSIGLITNRHYLFERGIKVEKRVGATDLREQQTTPSKYEGLEAAMAAEPMIGFWFGIGVILAVKMINSLDYYIGELISRK